MPRIEFDFTNGDLNLQLLLPMTMTVGCTGSSTCAKPVPAPTPPPPTPPPTMPRVAPVVYHMTSPTLANETLVVAGAGLDTVTAKLCKDAACTDVLSVAAPDAMWQKSVKMVLPEILAPPCFLSLTSPEHGTQTHVVNRPDIWWPTTGSPGVHTHSRAPPKATWAEQLTATVPRGHPLRVFGRSLAWSADNTACLSGALPPQPAAGTMLRLQNSAAAADGTVPIIAPMTATSASCYEATFDTTTLPPGAYAATIVTSWGASAPFGLVVELPDNTSGPTRIDVLKDCGGSLVTALQKAADVAAAGGTSELALGEHSYSVASTLKLPAGTTLRGAGASSTQLSFTLAREAVAIAMAANTSLMNFSIVVEANSTAANAVVVQMGSHGMRVVGLDITMLQNNVGSAFQVHGGRGFEIVENVLRQVGNCSSQEERVIQLDEATHGRIAGNNVQWRCAAFASDVSDEVVLEDNVFNCTESGAVHSGTYIATYSLYSHASSRQWSIARNAFYRPVMPPAEEDKDNANWQFCETLTTDSPHSYNMGYVTALSTNVTTGVSSVKLNSRMFPPAGATLVILEGPGTGQTRLVTGKIGAYEYSIDSAFDDWLVPNVSWVAALPTAGHKLVVGNNFTGTSVVQWFSNTLHGVHADNHFTDVNARSGIGGLEVGGALQAAGLCYKGAPGQVFFTEYLGNTMLRSDGITLVDDYKNTNMNDCASHGWFHGPWIQWATVRRNTISGVSELAKFDARQANAKAPRCGALTLRAGTGKAGKNTTDLVAEHQTYNCPPGMLPGGVDVVGCDHCGLR